VHPNGNFADVPRPLTIETDPAPVGSASTQHFTDDCSLTGGAPSNGTRFFRIKVVQ
jgi:hypothetical protein